MILNNCNACCHKHLVDNKGDHANCLSSRLHQPISPIRIANSFHYRVTLLHNSSFYDVIKKELNTIKVNINEVLNPFWSRSSGHTSIIYSKPIHLCLIINLKIKRKGVSLLVAFVTTKRGRSSQGSLLCSMPLRNRA